MDAVTEKNSPSEFPYESIQHLKTSINSLIGDDTSITAKSYDNRGEISAFTTLLSSKLSSFQRRLATNSFISDTFSWQIRTTVTSDSSGLLAKSSWLAEDKDYTLGVDSLSTARSVGTDKLDSDDASEFTTGTYSFTLADGDDEFSIDIEVSSPIGDLMTNKEVLREIETAINRLPSNVRATLHESKARDYNPFRDGVYKDVAYLTIQSKTTGEDADFSLTDTTGNLIDTLGLDRIRTFGLGSRYTVNGQSNTADSNIVSIDNGKMAAYLLRTTDEDESFTIGIEKDFQTLNTELVNIISDYNNLMQWLDDNNQIINPGLKATLLKDIDSIAVNNKNLTPVRDSSSMAGRLGSSAMVKNEDIIDIELEKIGLSINSDGTLDVTDDFFNALRSDLREVHEVLAGDNGFFTKINSAIENIVDKTEGNYVFSRNSVLSYDPITGIQAAYRKTAQPLISFYA
ncbi:MAG: flagellar filament capping protein FliD [Desulfobacteraceae bacterium]|nr:flagellar filament capping protein FliD [Desulfobacteraceae bacterium]